MTRLLTALLARRPLPARWRRGLRVEWLEDRLAPAYSATLVGNTATFVGDSAGGTGNILVFSQSGGFLVHNRGGVVGDPGFDDSGNMGEFDFDSTVAGVQMLPVSAASVVNVTTGGGPDAIQVGGSFSAFSAAASSLLAAFSITNSVSNSQSLSVDDSASTADTTYTETSTQITAPGISVSRGGQGFGGGVNLSTGSGNDTVNLRSVAGLSVGAEPVSFFTNGGNDTVVVGSGGNSLNGFVQAISVNAGAGTDDELRINDQGSAAANTYAVTPAAITRVADGVSVTLNTTVERVTLGTGAGADTVTVSATPTAAVTVNTGAGADSVVMADGATLNGGGFDGGTETDTLDYGAYATAVAANLGLGTAGLAAVLDVGQETTPHATLAAGTATISNYSVLNKTFDLSLTVTDLAPAAVTGLTLQRGAVGVDGPVVIDLLALGTLAPAGTGFTLTLTGVALGAANEAAFLGGLTYVNVLTAAAPGGLIRGQVFSTGNVNLTTGTATGVGSIAGVENVVGGSAADGLVGSSVANVLTGGAGDDVLVGGPGADAFGGGADNDTLVWSNGDGSDVMDGNAGNDRVQVNGALGGAALNDAFTVAANGTRVVFSRVSTGAFNLDIGTVEALTANGIDGADSFAVSDLTGVLDLTAVNLNGFAGADTFTVTPAPTVAVAVSGGAPVTTTGDTLAVNTAGATAPALAPGSAPLGLSGTFTFENRQTVTFQQVEAVSPTPPVFSSDTSAEFTQRAAGTFTVTTTGSPAATLALAAGTLPAGVTFDPATGVLAGTPTVAGTFPLTFTAANGITPDAVQSFTLTVAPNPALASGPVVTPAGPVVNVFTPDGTFVRAVRAFGAFAGPVSAAAADLNGDGTADIIVGAGAGGGPHVKAFDGATGAELRSFFAFGAGFRGGVSVAAGDVTGDAIPDLIVGAGAGGGPHVKAFDGATGAEVRSFFAFGPGFAGGVSVAAGDVNGDGRADIVVGAGAGGGPHVKAFDGATGAELRSFFAFGAGFAGGVSVAAGDVTGDGADEIFVGAGPGGGAQVKAFDGRTLAQLAAFAAFSPAPAGGVQVGATDADGDGVADLVAAAAGRPVRVFALPGGTELDSFLAPAV